MGSLRRVPRGDQQESGEGVDGTLEQDRVGIAGVGGQPEAALGLAAAGAHAIEGVAVGSGVDTDESGTDGASLAVPAEEDAVVTAAEQGGVKAAGSCIFRRKTITVLTRKKPAFLSENDRRASSGISDLLSRKEVVLPRGRIAMDHIEEILRLRHEARRTQREIASGCGIAQSSVHKVLTHAKAAGLGWPLPEGLDDPACTSCSSTGRLPRWPECATGPSRTSTTCTGS